MNGFFGVFGFAFSRCLGVGQFFFSLFFNRLSLGLNVSSLVLNGRFQVSGFIDNSSLYGTQPCFGLTFFFSLPLAVEVGQMLGGFFNSGPLFFTGLFQTVCGAHQFLVGSLGALLKVF